MVAPRRVRDIQVVLGRNDGTIRQDDFHVWVRLHDEDGEEYLAELPVEATTTVQTSNIVSEGLRDDLLPPFGSYMYATPKGTVPPLSNDLKIDLASLPVRAIAPPSA